MAEELTVAIRQLRGKRNSRRMRGDGKIPAVLYGHGRECVDLSVSRDAFDLVIRHGSRVVMLTGGVNEQAQIKDVQWNTWGNEVLHIDFTRVSEHEKIEVTLPVELYGEAPGLKDGGIVEQLIHQATLECSATAVPEHLTVSVNHLNLGDSVSLSALELPQGARFLDDPSSVVVHCVEPAEAPEEEAVEAGAEPEVIGEKEADRDSEEE